MTEADRQYFDTMEDLFGHPGWKLLVEESKRTIYNLQADSLDLGVCRTWDEVNVARGRAIQLNELVVLPEILAALREQAEEEVSDAD